MAILWRFSGRHPEDEAAERRAQRVIALSFFLLAAYVGAENLHALLTGRHPAASPPGIALAAFTMVNMPLLALAKRRVGRRLGSAATVGEGGQKPALHLPLRRL